MAGGIWAVPLPAFSSGLWLQSADLLNIHLSKTTLLGSYLWTGQEGLPIEYLGRLVHQLINPQKCWKEDSPLGRENWVRDHLGKWDIHKSLALVGMHPQC